MTGTYAEIATFEDVLEPQRGLLAHADRAMHKLWSKASDAQYDKEEWKALERAIWAIALVPAPEESKLSAYPELMTHEQMYQCLQRADENDDLGGMAHVVRALIQDSEAAIVLRDNLEATLGKRIAAMESGGSIASAIAHDRLRAAAGALVGQFRHEHGPCSTDLIGKLCVDVEELLREKA